MPDKCCRCGKESFVLYLKKNPGLICSECEDLERPIKKETWEELQKRMAKIYGR